jgi:hypothetical protein
MSILIGTCRGDLLPRLEKLDLERIERHLRIELEPNV